MSYSLHVNILLYSSDTSSPFHAQAQSFLQSCMNRRDLFYLIWPTIMGYLRIVTHPSIFDEPLTPEEAMANVETPSTACGSCTPMTGTFGDLNFSTCKIP